MVLEPITIGTRVFIVERNYGLLFTKTELKKAKARYEKALAKKLSRR